MSERPNCRHPDACVAKGSTHCRGCTAAVTGSTSTAKAAATNRQRSALRREAFLAQVKTCAGCGAQFSPTPGPKLRRTLWERRRYCTKTCGSKHAMELPEIRERQRLAVNEKFKDPEFRERHAASARINVRKAHACADPRKSSASRSRRVLGWIPEEFRVRYVRMREQFGAAQAQEIIRDHMAIMARRAVNQAAEAMRARAEREKAQAY